MTDTLNPNVEGNFVRTIASSLNFCVYFLLGLMYQIFFNVASAQLFESETIKNFYGRVQLIIGVFMVFKLAITILQGIMDPEKFMSNKEGFGSIITRVVVALIMLAVIVPINVPDVQNANSYEKYINNNGLLFGTLYSLQDRILSGNTLGRLILGTTDTAENPDAVDQTGKTEAQIQQEKLVQSANIFSSTILKGFLRINLVPEDERVDDDETNPENWYCGDHLTDDHRTVIDMYNQLDISPIVLLSDPVVKAKCNFNWQASVPGLKLIAGKSKYLFGFNFILALIVGAIFLVLLVAFTVDIAIRSIKLAILRLLAPIPIISYVEPKSAKDGMFASWVKALTSTYLDLFLRLAIVYFVIFIIQDMMVNGIIIDQAGGMVGIISCIFIWIGLFFFARMAPKFIKDVLGLKGPGMSNIGLSGVLGGAAMLAGGGGLRGAALGMLQGTEAAVQGETQGKPVPLGAAWSQNRDLMAKIRTGDKDARGGVVGGLMDRFNYQARERRAQQLGIGARDLADADYMSKFAQAEAANAKRDLDFAEQELQANPTDAGALNRYKDAYARNELFQARAAKAAKAYEKMDKDRALLGATPRVSDTRDRKYRVRQRINNTFGFNFSTSEEDFANKWNDRLGLTDNEHLKFQPGTYRSPQKVTNDPFATVGDHSGAVPSSEEDAKSTIEGHQRDVKNFGGTSDDEPFFGPRP